MLTPIDYLFIVSEELPNPRGTNHISLSCVQCLLYKLSDELQLSIFEYLMVSTSWPVPCNLKLDFTNVILGFSVLILVPQLDRRSEDDRSEVV